MHTATRTTSTLSLGGHALAAVRGGVAAIVLRWRAYRNRRAVIGLLDFDDRMLADIGLMRGDVTSALASPRDVDPSTRLRLFAVERRASIRAQARDRARHLADAAGTGA